MMKIFVIILLFFILAIGSRTESPGEVFPGADEKTPSRGQYFSWINNTNEGATETHTFINLDFFQWLHDKYGMKLDIYAFDAGAIDGKRFYGKMDSDRFREQFPNGFGPIFRKAKTMGTRLGIWGGPDGFGDTPAEEQARIDQMVSLCRDFEFALFKFDAVCGPLRPEKEDAFIRMMTQCRQYSPDLILLNHRLGLRKAKSYATTFLWEGKETYIDVFSTNNITAPHHRADALSRGLPPDLARLTEDHGVCLSSCLDYWEDDLILQAFNRCLILAPQIYGNPWLLKDNEFPRLARIFNLYRKYRDILVSGITLPENQYGPYAVSRGNAATRLITLRNLSWEPVTYTIRLDKSIGLTSAGPVHCRQFHPFERILGDFSKGQSVPVQVAPFRSCLLLVTTGNCDEPGVIGCDYEVVKNIPGKPVIIKLKSLPGTKLRITLPNKHKTNQKFLQGGLNQWVSGSVGQWVSSMVGKHSYESRIMVPRLNPETNENQHKRFAQHIGSPRRGAPVRFPGERLKYPFHRKLANLEPCDIPVDAEALYEATVFAADNNALEVRSLVRSGASGIPRVKKAREAFFRQAVFIERGIWDRNLFDGDMTTGFWPSRKYRKDQRVKGGCFRLDLGGVTDADRIVLHVPDEYSLQPLLNDEGNYVDVSTDLHTWERLTYLAGKKMEICLLKPVRYLRFNIFPDRIVEIEAYKDGKKLSRDSWRASNLFAPSANMKPVKAWKAQITLDEWVKNSYLCVALEGEHGVEGAYAALKVDGKLVGCPDRAPSFPSNTWEYVNARRDKNYTYYAPVTKAMIGKPVDVYVLAYDKEKTGFQPIVWISAYPTPFEEKLLELPGGDSPPWTPLAKTFD
jgi:hypothetical protein